MRSTNGNDRRQRMYWIVNKSNWGNTKWTSEKKRVLYYTRNGTKPSVLWIFLCFINVSFTMHASLIIHTWLARQSSSVNYAVRYTTPWHFSTFLYFQCKWETLSNKIIYLFFMSFFLSSSFFLSLNEKFYFSILLHF